MKPAFRSRRTLVALATAAVLALPGAVAAQSTDKPAAPLTGEALAVKKVLEQKFPGAEVRGIAKSPYFGLYEVQFDDRIIYTDAKAKYLVVGAIYLWVSFAVAVPVVLSEDKRGRAALGRAVARGRHGSRRAGRSYGCPCCSLPDDLDEHPTQVFEMLEE